MNEAGPNFYERFNKLSNSKVINFEMFTESGNKACSKLVRNVTKRICSAKKVNEKTVVEMLQQGIEQISIKHEEVRDSEPPMHIEQYINLCLTEERYSFVVDRYEICKT